MSHRYGYAEIKLSLQYAIRLDANPTNPAFEVTFPPQFQEYYEGKPNAIRVVVSFWRKNVHNTG